MLWKGCHDETYGILINPIGGSCEGLTVITVRRRGHYTLTLTAGRSKSIDFEVDVDGGKTTLLLDLQRSHQARGKFGVGGPRVKTGRRQKAQKAQGSTQKAQQVEVAQYTQLVLKGRSTM